MSVFHVFSFVAIQSNLQKGIPKIEEEEEEDN